MIRKIFVVTCFLMTCLQGVHDSPVSFGSLGRHPITPSKKEHGSALSSEQRVAEIITAWKAFTDIYTQKSFKQSSKTSLVDSLKKVRSLVKALPRELYSHKDILGIYRVRTSMVSNGILDQEISSLLVDEWPQIGCMYPQTASKEFCKRSRGYGEIKGDPIAKKLFTEETTSDFVPSDATPQTSFSSTAQCSSPTQRGISEAVINPSSHDQTVKSEPEVTSRLKMFTIGTVLGLVGYLCVSKAIPNNSLPTTSNLI